MWTHNPKKKELNIELAMTLQKKDFLFRKILMADIHSGPWGSIRVGICWDYVPTRLDNPMLIRPGKQSDYGPYI